MSIAGKRAVIGSDSENILAGAIQFAECSITGTNTSATITISSVDTANTLLVFSGGSHDGTQYRSQGRVTLTNPTTITITRDSATSATTKVGIYVVPFKAGVCQSIQYGTITISGGSSTGTATISSIVTANAEVHFLGCTSTNASPTNLAHVDITSPTQIIATRGGTTGTTIVSFVVIEPSSTYFVQKANATISAHASNVQYKQTALSARIDWSRSLILWKGYICTSTAYYPKAIIPNGDKYLVSAYTESSTVTSDATAIKVGGLQLSAGIRTSFVSPQADAVGNNDFTITELTDYTKCALSYLGSGGGLGSGAHLDYEDSGFGKITSDTNLRLTATIGTAQIFNFGLMQF